MTDFYYRQNQIVKVASFDPFYKAAVFELSHAKEQYDAGSQFTFAYLRADQDDSPPASNTVVKNIRDWIIAKTSGLLVVEDYDDSPTPVMLRRWTMPNAQFIEYTIQTVDREGTFVIAEVARILTRAITLEVF